MSNFLRLFGFLSDVHMGYKIGCWLWDDVCIPAWKEALEELEIERNGNERNS